MVASVTAVLKRLRTEGATQLHPDAIIAACEEAGYTSWRDRVPTPVPTIQLFLLQILHGHTACSHLPHLSGLRFSAAAYCQARARLPLRLFDLLLERFSPVSQAKAGGMATAYLWSMVRDAPCPIRQRYRLRSASRRSSGQGVGFLWRISWGCSMPAPGCS